MALSYNELTTLISQLYTINLDAPDSMIERSKYRQLRQQVNYFRSATEPILMEMDQDDLTRVIDEMVEVLEELDKLQLLLLQLYFQRWIDSPEQQPYFKDLETINNLLNQLNFN